MATHLDVYVGVGRVTQYKLMRGIWERPKWCTALGTVGKLLSHPMQWVPAAA